MTLSEHLAELRYRVIMCVVAFVVAATVAVFALRADPALPSAPALRRERVDPAADGHVRLGAGVGRRPVQPLRDLAPRRAVAAGQDRRLRRPRPGLARDPVPGLALRHARASRRPRALRHPLRAQLVRAVPPRRGDGLLHPAARPGLAEVGRRARPGPDLRPHSVPGPDPADDGPVRPHLRVPGGAGLAGAGARRHAGPPAAVVALGRHHHRGGGGRVHAELRPVLHARPGRAARSVFYFVSIGIGKLLGR